MTSKVLTVIETLRRELEQAAELGKSQAFVELELDPEGDGVLLARSATFELNGRAVIEQARLLLSCCETSGERPRILIAATGSGARPLEERPDLQAVLAALDAGCTWFATRDIDRIGRGTTPVVQFLCAAKERSAKIFFPEQTFQPEAVARLLSFRESYPNTEPLLAGLVRAESERSALAGRAEHASAASAACRLRDG